MDNSNIANDTFSKPILFTHFVKDSESLKEEKTSVEDSGLQYFQKENVSEPILYKSEKKLVEDADLLYNNHIPSQDEISKSGEPISIVKQDCGARDMFQEVSTNTHDPFFTSQNSNNTFHKIFSEYNGECIGEWKTMKCVTSNDQDFANNDLYSETSTSMDFLQGNVKGYTKLNSDEHNILDKLIDEQTSYLFSQENSRNENITVLSKMEFTKDLLIQEQRIAYVGVCKLILVEMIREVSSLPLKRNNDHMFMNAAQNMELWSQKILARLYSHMNISSDEQIMIENLSKHGILIDDLASILMTLSPINDLTNILLNDTYSDDNEIPFFVSNINTMENSSNINNKKMLNLNIRWTIICNLFLILIADSVYDSRSRVFLQRVGKAIHLSSLEITMFEKKITDELILQENFETFKNSNNALKLRDNLSKNRRYILMSLATISGGLLIGLSSGILAPLIGAGLGAAFTTIGVTGTSGFLAGTGGATLITTGGVITGSSIAGKKMSNRIKNIKTFEFKPIYDNKRLNLLITVPGWMLKKDDVRLPFSTIDPIMGDIYSLLWEPEILQSIGKTINILAIEILTQSLQQILGQTVLVALMSALQWPLILTKLGYLIDNPFVTSLQRAKAAGLVSYIIFKV